jgi:uncharacterized protein YndB with AHSA1/START domain
MNEALLMEKAARRGAHNRRRTRAGQWSLGISICVNADVRRIFQVFTVPEYLETWMCLPGSDADSYVTASRTGNDYRLDFFRAGCLHSSIAGSYLVCRHRKMLLTWSNIEANHAITMVDIRLRGNFGSSILELQQTGFASASEYFSQLAMWRASLERLVRLMRNSRRGTDAVGPLGTPSFASMA